MRSTAQESAAGAELPPFAARSVLGLAVAAVVLLVAFASRYGYHRDELYFLAASRHLDWGYVDQPPIAVLVAWLNRVALGDTLVGLRVIPAVVVGGVVTVTGCIAREFGGSRFAQGFAAACVATGGFLVVGHLEGPTVYDALTWVLVSWLVVRLLRTGNDRLWVLVGLVVGVGLEAKQTVLLLLAGLAVGFLVNRQRALFASRWLWVGVLVAFVGWAPNLVWEATNGWPTRAMDSSLRAEHSGVGFMIKYPFLTVLAMGVLLAPIWLAGAWVLWAEPRFRRYRAFAVAFAIDTVFLWIVIPDRFYYLVGIYPILFAAGAIVTEQVVAGERGFFRPRPKNRWLWRSHRAAIGVVVLNFLLFLPVALPVLPESAVAAANLNKLNYNLGEEIGWPELTEQVSRQWRGLPPSEQSHAVVFTGNYGEAGALIHYAPGHGVPPAYSAHNSFWWWGPPPDTATTVLAVGTGAELAPWFKSCRVAVHVHNHAGVHNDENGTPVSICTGRTTDWAQIWPTLKHYG